MDKLKELLEDFYRISGKGIAIVDKNFCTVLTRSSHDAERFCTYIHQSPRCLESCLVSDKQAFHNVEKTRDTYIYKCPYGITEALIPIFDANTVIGYFFVVLGLETTEQIDLAAKKVLETDPRLDFLQLKTHASYFPNNITEISKPFLNMLNVMGDYIVRHGLLKVRRLNTGMLVKEHIDNNIDKKITLMSLSKAFHCSTVTLTQSFRREFNTSIMQYLAKKRLEKASLMLSCRGLTIGEIASSCGFSDAEYFSKCFKKQYGLCPMEWKKHKEQKNSLI